jgi:hypothetical protein
MAPNAHDTGPTGVTVDDLVDELFPVIDDLLGQIEGDEFTTIDFIELMQSVPGPAEAYDHALRKWGEQERQSKMVLHGQVIPAAMRRSGKVQWMGFAHGLADEYAVPAWWKLVEPA